MDVILLGTGSPIPNPNRAGPATLIRSGETNILFDCGRGVVMRLAAAGVMPSAVSAIMITHMHSDHISALNDVITSHWVLNVSPVPLFIYGPKGIRELVDATVGMLAPDMKYRLDHHDDLNEGPDLRVTEMEPGDTIKIGDKDVTAYRTDHSPVFPTLGYRVSDERATVAIAGDTIPCEGLDALCKGADIYVQTVVRDDLIRQIPSTRLNDILDYHSTVEQAAQTAARAGVRTLMLTHYVPPLMPGQEEAWRSLARAHFTGEILLGDDLTSAST